MMRIDIFWIAVSRNIYLNLKYWNIVKRWREGGGCFSLLGFKICSMLFFPLIFISMMMMITIMIFWAVINSPCIVRNNCCCHHHLSEKIWQFLIIVLFHCGFGIMKFDVVFYPNCGKWNAAGDSLFCNQILHILHYNTVGFHFVVDLSLLLYLSVIIVVKTRVSPNECVCVCTYEQ